MTAPLNRHQRRAEAKRARCGQALHHQPTPEQGSTDSEPWMIVTTAITPDQWLLAIERVTANRTWTTAVGPSLLRGSSEHEH